MAEVWALVHAERAALVHDLEGVSTRDWARPSLCGGWTVHDVVAHLVDSAATTRLGFVVDLVRARFDFDRVNARGVARAQGATPHDTLERLRRVATRTSTPPAPLDSRLVEEVVHGEDVRRPLGLGRDYPIEAVERALRLQLRTSEPFGGAQQRAEGLRLVPSDGLEPMGDGPEVAGSPLALLLAMSGRRVALAELDGPGVAVLRERL